MSDESKRRKLIRSLSIASALFALSAIAIPMIALGFEGQLAELLDRYRPEPHSGPPSYLIILGYGIDGCVACVILSGTCLLAVVLLSNGEHRGQQNDAQHLPCEHCGYDLCGSRSRRCPECGNQSRRGTSQSENGKLPPGH